MTEPEHKAEDGSTRKSHYGTGRQPWDDIVDLGWGPAFAAGNALKYVRRAAAKNGEDDLRKGGWYYNELLKRSTGGGIADNRWLVELRQLDYQLTPDERDLLSAFAAKA